MSLAYHSPRPPFWQRLFFTLPVIGWIARDLIYGDKDTIWYALVAFFSAWGCAIVLFGLPGLYLPAVAMVPVMFLVPILISIG